MLKAKPLFVVEPCPKTSCGSGTLATCLRLALLVLAAVISAAPAHAGAQYDGPAELPLVTVASTMSDTPAPGSIISVNAGGNLQQAINSAQCGDIVELQAGATFTGQFNIPAKGCDSNHWIIIRTSAPDSSLPAEGTRLTPCYAGVASLEGRPQYTCNHAQNVTAKIANNSPGTGPFQFSPGAAYYRFLGLEVTRLAGTPGPATLIAAHATADHIVFDRSWFHGAAQDETFNGISLNGMTNVAIVDSYFSDFHCINGGQCMDSHAISGGVSNTQDGPFKIQDNFLEASGEDVLFGGGPVTKAPTDIEILNNHFWKPWQWMPGNPHFMGGPNHQPFVVKNHLEFKNAVRVLVDSNIMENVWGGFSQYGYAILVTPKNQHSGDQNVCPKCEVTDITIRFTRISHAGGGMQLATALSGGGKAGAPALAGTRWSIHDLVLDDISTAYTGEGILFQVTNGWAKNPLNTVTINHVTGFPDSQRSMVITGNLNKNPRMYGLVFTNNLLITGEYPVWNSGNGRASCAFEDVPINTLTRCFTTYTFSNNGLITPPQQYGPSTWPKGNMYAKTVADVGFTDFNNGNGGNYQLLPSSPYKNKGTDGKDLGADIPALNQALASVE